MSQEIEVRQAELRDLAALIELMEEFYAESGYEVDAPLARQTFAAFISDRSLGSVMVADNDGGIAGYVILRYSYTMTCYGYVCVIEDLFVSKKFRKMGVGDSLLDHASRSAKELGISNFSVEVGEDNIAAVHLYRKHGFVEREKGIILMEKNETRK